MKTIGYNGIHDIFRHTQWFLGKRWEKCGTNWNNDDGAWFTAWFLHQILGSFKMFQNVSNTSSSLGETPETWMTLGFFLVSNVNSSNIGRYEKHWKTIEIVELSCFNNGEVWLIEATTKETTFWSEILFVMQSYRVGGSPRSNQEHIMGQVFLVVRGKTAQNHGTMRASPAEFLRVHR